MKVIGFSESKWRSLNKKEVKALVEPPAGCCSCNKRARFFLHSPVGFSCQCDAEWECNDFSLCSEKSRWQRGACSQHDLYASC